jgi:hypothetical protein
MPSLPGATWTSWPSLAQRQASACSRPPLPKMTMRMLCSCPETAAVEDRLQSVVKVTLTGEDHGQAVLVGGGDHLVVAHRAAGLDDRGDAGGRRRVDAVAEREEGVGAERRRRGRAPRRGRWPGGRPRRARSGRRRRRP